MRTLIALVLVLALAAVPVYPATETVDQSVSRRYASVTAKAHAHTLRSADVENLIVAVDLRNRDAARRNIDVDADNTLRARKAEFAARIITPAEAAKIHAMHPELSEQAILDTNHRDRAKDIDEFLAHGGVRAAWRDELIKLRESSRRIAQLDGSQPQFRTVFYSAADAHVIDDINPDGFYYGFDSTSGSPTQPIDQCTQAGILAALFTVICYLTGGMLDGLINPSCWAMVYFLVGASLCPAL